MPRPGRQAAARGGCARRRAAGRGRLSRRFRRRPERRERSEERGRSGPAGFGTLAGRRGRQAGALPGWSRSERPRTSAARRVRAARRRCPARRVRALPARAAARAGRRTRAAAPPPRGSAARRCPSRLRPAPTAVRPRAIRATPRPRARFLGRPVGRAAPAAPESGGRTPLGSIPRPGYVRDTAGTRLGHGWATEGTRTGRGRDAPGPRTGPVGSRRNAAAGGRSGRNGVGGPSGGSARRWIRPPAGTIPPWTGAHGRPRCERPGPPLGRRTGGSGAQASGDLWTRTVPRVLMSPDVRRPISPDGSATYEARPVEG